MGLALGVKIIPIVFIPAAFWYLPNWKSRLQFALSTGGVFFITGLPYFATEPRLILHMMSRYNSLPMGIWSHVDSLAGIGPNVHKAILAVLILLLSAAMNWSKPRLPLFAQCGLLTACFLFFAPGFAIQYFAWTVPMFGYLGLSVAALYYLLAGTALFLIYTNSSLGVPWYEARALVMPPVATLLLFLCWYMVGVMFLMYIRAWRNQRASSGQHEANATGVEALKENQLSNDEVLSSPQR